VLSTLTRVEKLSISSNCIDKIVNFPPLKYITRLSLARNNIKKISGLEEIAGTLKELWLSYNQVEKLEGLSMCMKLTTLFIGSTDPFT
jgi:dynein light chain 1